MDIEKDKTIGDAATPGKLNEIRRVMEHLVQVWTWALDTELAVESAIQQERHCGFLWGPGGHNLILV